MKITYLCPALDIPIGGIKVIYRHSEILSSIGFESYVLHPENPNFSCTWFSHKVKTRDSSPFSKADDFIVIPEIWASNLGQQSLDRELKYGIFVQNCYLAMNGEFDILKKVYERANLIMSISEDTSSVISLAFPRIDKSKFIQIIPYVNALGSGKKQKKISYMPRRLPDHSQKVIFLLKSHLPPDWSISPIDGVGEDDALKALSESSIFLSFSDMEGLGLPPIEAALSGNLVVGYTGQGGKEYFKEPLFRRVENGNFQVYIEKILLAIGQIDDGLTVSSAYEKEINRLREEYSSEKQLKSLEVFAKAVEFELRM